MTLAGKCCFAILLSCIIFHKQLFCACFESRKMFVFRLESSWIVDSMKFHSPLFLRSSLNLYSFRAVFVSLVFAFQIASTSSLHPLLRIFSSFSYHPLQICSQNIENIARKLNIYSKTRRNRLVEL